MTPPTENPFLNNLPTDTKTVEVGFLIVLLAIIFLIGVGYFVLHFGVPIIEDVLAQGMLSA